MRGRPPRRRPSAQGLLLALALAATAPAAGVAQEAWSGGAAIGLAVTDKGGVPLPGARVTLRSTALDPPAGPPPLLTDREGRAAFTGLREGEWYLEIAHPDHMRFTAYVEARAGKAPKSTFSAQLATPSSWVPMRVSFHRPRGPAGLPAPDVMASRPAAPSAPAQPPRPPAPPAAPEPAAPAPAAPPVAEPEAVAPPAPAPAPAPVEEPSPPEEPAAPEPPTPRPEPAPEPAPEPSQAPPAASSPPPTPAPAPTPPAVEPPPAPARPVEGPSAPPAPPPRRAPVQVGPRVEGCPECRAGESALAAASRAWPGGPGCTAGLLAEVRAALAAAAAGVASAEPISGRLAEVLGRLETAGGPAMTLPVGAAEGSCAVVVAVLPQEARYLGYRFDASDETGAGDCLAGDDCPIGQARWLEHPGLLRTGSLQIVYGAFENRHPQRQRTARLTVYYRARPAWAPTPSPPPR